MKPYTPTPEEIRARCLAIQSEWSDAERDRRNCYRTVYHDYGQVVGRAEEEHESEQGPS